MHSEVEIRVSVVVARPSVPHVAAIDDDWMYY